jgi:hypothetical protein
MNAHAVLARVGEVRPLDRLAGHHRLPSRARTIAGLPGSLTLSHPANVRPVAAPRFGELFVQDGFLGATSASMQTATNTPPTIASAIMPTTQSGITIWHYPKSRRWRAGHRAFRRGAQLRSAVLAIGLPEQFRQPRDVDGDASHLVRGEHLRLPRLVLVVAGVTYASAYPLASRTT